MLPMAARRGRNAKPRNMLLKRGVCICVLSEFTKYVVREEDDTKHYLQNQCLNL